MAARQRQGGRCGGGCGDWLTEQGHCVIVAAELLPKAIDWEGWWQGSVPPP